MITALKGQIIVEIELRAPEHTTSGGILVTQAKVQGIPNTGTVTSVGEDVTACKVGDRIVFKEEKPAGFRLDDKRYFRIEEKQVLGIFEEEK